MRMEQYTSVQIRTKKSEGPAQAGPSPLGYCVTQNRDMIGRFSNVQV